MKYHKVIFNYKKIFIGGCLTGVIYVSIAPFFYVSDDDKNKLIKIPSEFSGFYITDTSSSPMVVSLPLIASFL